MQRINTNELDARRLWIARNRTVLTRVGKKLKVSTQFVSMVLYGKRESEGGRVERELRKEGAPL